MSVWYHYVWWRDKPIETVEVIKETDQFVIFKDDFYTKPQRRAKNGEYFPTFEALKEYQIKQAERRLQNADDERSRAIEHLKKMRALELE